MGSYKEELHKLNAAQRQAVEHIDGPLMVIAGPGTGKTQLLSMRVAQILQKTDANPANILCLTFTEAAARNMRDRLSQLIGEAAYHVGIYTFHGFGSEIIQRYPEYFIEQPLLKPVEELGSYELLADIFQHLPHSNPLQTKLGDEFLHLRATQTTISWLKQAGIEPDDLASIVKGNRAFTSYAQNLLPETFADRPHPKHLPIYEALLAHLRAFPAKEADSSLAQMCTNELASAIDAIQPDGRFAPSITAWRNRWLVQDSYKHWRMADQRRTSFLEALGVIYKRYQKALADRGWYTYDDMILRAIKALEQEPELRLTLQEQFQYLMVDEYQDTNGAQNRLLELLADNPVHEGQPNLMVVGDDDQAIYRFQGAELSVMLDFLKRWQNVTNIVLNQNYRSGSELLQLARSVIVHGTERLETAVEGVSKELQSGHATPPPAKVVRIQGMSELDQYAFVAKEVERLIKQGKKPSDIAILAPKHSYLREIVPFLLDKQLPVSYERREHILTQPKIIELLDLARLIQLGASGDWAEANALLPQVLSADYWQFEPQVLWQISLDAYKHKRLWLEIMLDHPDKRLRHCAEAITTLAFQTSTRSLDDVLDTLIGNQPVTLADGSSWQVPYRRFYFSNQRLQSQTQDYFTLLGQLTTLRERLREYRPGQPLNLANLVEFVSLYQRSALNLLDTNPHTTTPEAVELMTAYKAKGLEWDTVFVLSCHNDVWGSKTRSGSFSFGLPHNLESIKPARDSLDDKLRLFYVALTRAKSNLYLTSHQKNLNGKPTESLIWLNDQPAPKPLPAAQTNDLIHNQAVLWGLTQVQKRSLKDSLQTFLTTYQLSATHLNSFFDLTRGGPQHFFFRHILHFPEAITPSSVFGSAVHEALHYVHTQVIKQGKPPKLAQLQAILTKSLQNSALPNSDKQRLIERGCAALDHVYQQIMPTFTASDKSEYNFKNEGVVLGDARLTGKIDVLRQTSNNQLAVVDYKTGNALQEWQAKGAYPQIRAHLYQQQLAFYKLMVEGSASYNKQQVTELALQFVEPNEDGQLVYLPYQPKPQDLDRLQKLVAAVWKHVMELDFPDTSQYSLDLKGVKQFEDDVIDGKL
ncbi:MAG: ATP-dependent helicase UvrD/PcrA [Patescibacteria group bacterium]|nr:ATP-dependent helicase UvrD/PcrA [Patescibacteria group bacterium]